VPRYGDYRRYSNVHVQSFNLESASGAAGSSNFVSLHFLTTGPPYKHNSAVSGMHIQIPFSKLSTWHMEIPVVQESKNRYQSQQSAPCQADAARQHFHSNNSSDVILIMYYFSSSLLQALPYLELYRLNLPVFIPLCSMHYQSNSSENE
jgi:hypothetical protein